MSLANQARELLESAEKGLNCSYDWIRLGSTSNLIETQQFIAFLKAVIPVLEGKSVHLPLGASEEYRERRTFALAQMAAVIYAQKQGLALSAIEAIDDAEMIMREAEKRSE